MAGRLFCLLSAVWSLALFAQPAPPPITGPALPGMERFDSAVTGLMARFNSPGAQLAVTRNGRLVLARVYGFADREGQPKTSGFTSYFELHEPPRRSATASRS